MEPRIPPLSLADADPETRALLERLSRLRGDDAAVLNVFGTLAQHPTLLREWLGFATHLLTRSTLEARLRELVILRTGWLTGSPYEWGQHVVIARTVRITDEEVARVAAGPDASGWTDVEAAALRAADELHGTNTIGDATWAALTRHFDTHQVLELVFLVGQYHLVAFALNACRVARDDGIDDGAVPFPSSAGGVHDGGS
jgi:4-carboxymuconolactone decarboxylase